MKQCWPAPERNKGPILDVLMRVLPPRGLLLELASGTGQHVVHFARHLGNLTFQPSDISDENLASIRQWIAEAGLPNVRPPIRLDVMAGDWGVEQVDAIFCANMIHITPWECTLALFEGVGRHLSPAGMLVLYGPFSIGGEHTAPSNAAFDADLKMRDSRWGVRDKHAITELASATGLVPTDPVAMPANNLTLVFKRT